MYNVFFPLRTVRVRQEEPLWMKLSLTLLINDRDRAFCAKQHGKFVRLREEVIHHVKFLQSEFLRAVVRSNDPKKL